MRFVDFQIKIKVCQIKVGQGFGKVKLVDDGKFQRWSCLMITCHNYDYLSVRLFITLSFFPFGTSKVVWIFANM